MHSKKMSANARRAILTRMSPEQIAREDNAKLAILNDFLARHDRAEMTMQEAMGVA